MTTPDEVTALFAEASESFSRISGQPSDDALNEILLVVRPFLHIIEYDMAGPNNLVGLVDNVTAYTTTWGQAWVNPPRPASYDPNIDEDATRVVQNRMEAAHRVLIADHAIYLAAEKAVAKFIRDAVEETYYKDLDLAPYVGCRRVVFLPKRRHSVSCRRHVADMFQYVADTRKCRVG